MSRKTAGFSEAGPSVAIIFVARNMKRSFYSLPRSTNTANAGNVLPSRNSRKAPPPVEM
jgi:hypothetical protein